MENIIIGKTVSEVWCKMLDAILKPGRSSLSPVLIMLQDLDPDQCEIIDPVREALDAVYKKHGLNSVNTVANTIFPLSLYKLAKFDRERLFELYMKTLERRKAIDNRNSDGIYFERLISYNDSPRGNQLKFIIDEFTGRKGVRKSLLQASVFDPKRDHKRDAQIGFPCLQHVSFTYDKGKLSTHAFYATQQLFDKAYGNILGLVRLGNFMAREMGLSLTSVNCYVGLEKLERIAKGDTDLGSIVKIAKKHLSHE